MAAEGPNGVYNGYQGHESSIGTTGASVSSQPATSTTSTVKPDALEIGWYFVEQYYTTLSKNPERIHLFYSKKSQLVTGKEAEKVVPNVGQKAISDKIKELEFKDCKVRVSNVDSQASYQNIVVQVIGEMSNNAQPHNKFVQTFVLAEQPNGYFVLNDIFRYIDLGDEEGAEEEPAVAADVTEEAQAVPEPPLPTKESHESVADEAAAKELDQKLEEITIDEKKAESAVETNGLSNDVEEEEKPVEIAAEPEVAAVEPAVEVPSEPDHSRAPSPPKEAAAVPAAESAPAKKTWASLVGAKAPASPAVPAQPSGNQTSAPKPAAAAPAPAVSASPAPETASQPSAQGNGWQTADHGKKQKTQQKADQVVLAYVKGVTEKVDARVLRSSLEKYGELKYFDVSRPKNCAFVEFATTEGYNAAAAANPHVINGENILVEERRPRAGQFGNAGAGTGAYGRGGSNTNRGRGGFQGRTGSQSGSATKDAGRSNFQSRSGNKGGNVTPKARGQAQAA